MAFDPTTANLVSDEFDPTTAKPVSGGATGEREPDTEMSLSSEIATRVPKIPGVGFVAEVITTPLDLIDMGVGVFGLIAKTIEQGGLVLYEHSKAAMQGETIDPEAMKNISGFMAEQSAKPEYAASLAPIRTAFEQAGTPLSETPITRVFGGITEAIEKGSEAAGEYTGTEAVKYGGPMVSEGLMALFAAHGINKVQAKKTINTIRAEKVKEAQAAGLTTNEMAETILKKAAKDGIKVPEEMKGQIKASLEEIAEYYGTGVERRKGARATKPQLPQYVVEAKDVGLVPKLEGIHYSQAERPVLSGKFYGTGAKGAERTRLAKATDTRIKSRVAFYINEGQGVFPEQGVGRYAHEVQLDNLYDAAKNPLKLPAEPNAFESAVIDAGFDGYYVKEALGRQGAAVVLGDAAKEIKVPKKTEPVFNLEAQKEWIETRTREIPKERAVAEAEVIISLPEGLQKAAKQMIERSQRGLRGGLVIDAAENLNTRYAEKLTKFSGRTKEDELRWIKKKMPQIPGAEIGGFYDPNTGVVFLNASSKRAATDRLLHEISHASDNPKINAEIMNRLAGGAADESGLYARVRTRMENAQARFVPTEATAYLVSEVMAMGRQAGFSRLDTGFWQWATKALPPETLNWIKNIVAQVRATLYKYGAALKESDLTPDDIVALTKSNMKDIAKGAIETATFQDRGLNIKTPNKISSAELYKEVVDESKKKIIDAEMKGLKDFTPDELPRLLEKNNWAIITAENPKGKQLTAAENTHRMAAMRAELKAAGITFHEAEGVFNATKEHVLVLTNTTKQQALEIAQRWEQEATITKDGLLYTDGTTRPATGLQTYSERPTALTDHTYIPETGTSFNIKVGGRKQTTSITPQVEAEFAKQRQGQPHKIKPEEKHKAQQAEVDSIITNTTLEPLTKIGREIGKARGRAFKQRGAIGYLYVPTLEDAIKLASQREGMVGKQVERGWRVEVPMSLEEASKLAPEDVINWSKNAEDYAKLDYFKKQRGAADPKLLITSGIILGGATLGAALSPDLETTQGLLLGTAIGFGLTRLPQATKALSHNWKNAIKTTAVGATYATVGYTVDKENPVEGILVGSALFGTRFLPKTKVHPEDALINARNGNIAAEKRLTAMISKAMKDAVPDKAQREQLSVLMENPKFLGRTPQEKLVVDAWRGMAQSYHDIAINENVKMGFIDGYVSHIIERNALPQSEVNKVMVELFGTGQQGTGGRAKFTKERMYPTFESLEKALEGTMLKLKTKDIAEITQIYSETMTRTIENQRLINNLKEATLGDAEGRNARLLTTEQQPGYVHLSNPQLLPYFVHPDIAPALKFVFDSRNHGDIVNGLIALNRATKRMNVIGSFFHAKSLLEAYALAGGNIFNAKGAIDAALKQFREGGLGDELDLGMRTGLRVELPTEVSQQALVQVGQLADYYTTKMMDIKIGGEKALGYMERKQLETFDKFTWDYLHTGLKTATYLRLMEDYKLGRKGKGISEDVFRQGTVSHINDTFGGLDWYRVVSEAKTEAGRKLLMWGLKPSARDYLGVAMFAPDWTISTIRAMTKALPGGSKNPANALLARQYALRTAALYASFMVPINYALSGHFPWDDEQKDPTRIDLGDGTNLQVVKHSMEFAEWVRDPWKTFSNKMGFLPRTFESLRYGKQYPKGPDIEGNRLGYVLQQTLPFTARAFQGDTDPETSAKRALLGMMGISVYGMSEEEKEYAKEQRQLRKEEEE